MNEWELMNDGFVSFIDVSHIYKRPVHETKTFFFHFIILHLILKWNIYSVVMKLLLLSVEFSPPPPKKRPIEPIEADMLQVWRKDGQRKGNGTEGHGQS